ncbi:DinB family protein [Streptomyces sp. XD-27]|uniref:DinB family protein n=1 Tax=Streptomyces sp. XD-27 TaxID=3062779 RepID=UPI0026F44CBF|nr:DinB family protein [Streptomyces sp. XD-27]WKX74551.1 DinB family protein [Streptomyces sp. XD-27]
MAAMTTTERTIPTGEADERTMLENWLEFHRETLAAKCEGLSDEQLREASAPPSDLTLLGLVRHMAEVERAWFRRVLSQQEIGPLYYSEEDPDGDLHVSGQDTAKEAFDTWRAEIAAARESAARHALDDTGVWKRRKSPGEDRVVSLRWIYVHMIEEYARHNGHADLLRERIDGATGS